MVLHFSSGSPGVIEKQQLIGQQRKDDFKKWFAPFQGPQINDIFRGMHGKDSTPLLPPNG
jgi:hypothetical protein